jgi:hypothetical protein
MPWHHRLIGNPVLSFIGRLFFKAGPGDFHCGLRGFDRDAILGLNLRTTGMEFASEMLVKATMMGLPVTEVPTTLSRDGRSRPPHLRSFRDGWRHLRFLLLFSPRWLFLYPGFACLGLGLFLGTLLIGGPVHLSPTVVIDLHSFLIAAMLILVGLQAVSFAVIGRRFASHYGFLPPSETFGSFLEALTLERVLVAALVLFVIGVAALLWGFGEWAHRGFGPLNLGSTMRVMIVAVTTLVAGIQLAMTAFMASLINVPLIERRIAATPPFGAPRRRVTDRTGNPG